MNTIANFISLHPRAAEGVSLYGGALSMALPRDFVDASQFRQVPDHQEVFVDMCTKDATLIVELFDPSLSSSSSERLWCYHFNVLSQENGSTCSRVIGESEITINNDQYLKAHSLELGLGYQSVPKFGKMDDLVLVVIALATIYAPAPIDSDIVISLSIPLDSGQELNIDETARLTEYFSSIVATFRILDPTMFNSR